MAMNPQQWHQQGMTRAQAAEMLRLQRRADRRGGCLMAIVWTLLFGVFYWAWLGIKWTAKGSVVLMRVGWALFVAYPVKWTIVGCRWAWLGTVAATRLAMKGARSAAPLAVAAVASVTSAIQRRGLQAQMPTSVEAPAPTDTPLQE